MRILADSVVFCVILGVIVDYCGFLGYFNDYRNNVRAVDSSVTKALMIRPFIAARNGSIFALPQAIPTTIRASEART